MSFFTRLLGDPNERELKRIRPIVERINTLEDEIHALSDSDLKAMTGEFKQELENGASLDDILPEAFAVVRETSQRVLGMRHFDVQLIGGVVLHEGKIAEMRTGEGKTLVATLPSYLNALTGKGVHIVTVNDYLAQRDRNWMGKIHEFLDLSVGVILSSQQPQSAERKAAYAADITYGTNNELGFDYLRDHMVSDISICMQRELNFAIVDEVDNILIDEARTPLIISGEASESAELYIRFARLVPLLKPEVDYTVDVKDRTVAITDEGIDKVERLLHIKNIYDNMELTRHLENALKARALFARDKEYIVKDGEVLIVDEHTGRVLQGRRYSEGLHQAIEAKENVRIQQENRTLATITYQNFFRLYNKLAGMTGTAMTEAEEFHKIYKLDVITIPTHRPIRREDRPDFIYATEAGKFRAVVNEIIERHEAGQPVLVGTTSVEVSEQLSEMLSLQGIPHEVLNAKQHAREAHIVAQAGRSGAVTIATNMAGRGTDIVLGGNPDEYVEAILREWDIDPEFATDGDREDALKEAKKRTEADRKKVLEAGGLYIIGTERHESRRIDNQLRGRSGRQGDPGESRFFVSLEDELMRRFGADNRLVRGIMSQAMDDDTPLESRALTGILEQAQTKVEAFNFDIRKNVVEYDDVIAAQRKVIYGDRQEIIAHKDMRDRGIEMIERQARRMVEAHTKAQLPENWNFEALNAQLATWGISIPEEIIPEDLNRLRRETLINAVVEAARKQYEAKEANIIKEIDDAHRAGIVGVAGLEVMRTWERQVFLGVLDTLWREHLDHLDILRSGIGLRSMAQRDPLVEFKREGFVAFEELKANIEAMVADILMRNMPRVEVTMSPEQAKKLGQGAKKGLKAGTNGTAKAQPKQAPKPQQKALPAPTPARPAANNGASKPSVTRPLATAANGNGAKAPPATVPSMKNANGTATTNGANGTSKSSGAKLARPQSQPVGQRKPARKR